MLNLKSIYYYFLAIKITLLKSIKKIYFSTNYYNKSLLSKTPQQFYFHPNPFLLSSLTNYKKYSFKISEIDPNIFWLKQKNLKGEKDRNSFLWLNLIISIKNYYIFKNFSKILLYTFIFLIFFQFNVLRTSTSFYNEGIYYPVFLTTLISLDNLIQKKIKLNFTNKMIVYFFFAAGPFFQLIHLF